MLIVFGPSFEVVTEGWILHFVSGDRRFVVDEGIIQGVAVPIATGTIPAGSTLENQPLTRKISK